jgi:BASS family bile acid:Na+ symporter
MDLAMLIRIAIVISVMLIVVALGLRCALADTAYLLRRPSLLVRSLVAMNIIMPLAAVWLVSSFDLKTPIKVALVALAISPLPPFLPGKRLKLTSHGYIYGIVVAAAVCSVVLVPITASLLAAHFHTQHVGAVKVFLVIVITVIAPLYLGLFIQRKRTTRAPALAAILYKAGMGLLVVACIPVLVMEWPTIRSLFGDGTVVAAVLLSGLGLLVGHLLGGPDPQNRTVLALATASRHPGVALVAGISASAQSPRLITAAVLFAFVVSMIVTVPYAAWRRRVHAALEDRGLKLRSDQGPISGNQGS